MGADGEEGQSVGFEQGGGDGVGGGAGGVGEVEGAEGVGCVGELGVLWWGRGERKGKGRTAENPKGEICVPGCGTGRVDVALAVGFGLRAAVHAAVGVEAAGDAEVAAVAFAVADDFGGGQ